MFREWTGREWVIFALCICLGAPLTATFVYLGLDAARR